MVKYQLIIKIFKMKKILFLLMFAFAIGFSTNAQDDKNKTKKTSTIPQKVHNTVSKDKKYKGYKTKRKHNGVTKKRKVNLKDGEVKTKTDK
jgi:uncharacterized membrane protein